MVAELTAATFRPHEGEAFAVHPGTPGLTPIELTLIEVTEYGAAMRADDDRRVPFSLLFRGPAQPLLPSGVHTLAHPQVGEHAVFMNPVQAATRGSSRAPGISYEVVFN